MGLVQRVATGPLLGIKGIGIEPLLAGITGGVIAYLVIPPLVFVFIASFYAAEGFGGEILTLANYDQVLSADTGRLLKNSLVFAGASSLLALSLGTALAWVVERTNTPLRKVAYFSAFVSLAVPGIIKTVGWVMLLGPRGGILTTWIMGIFNLETLPFNLYTLYGMTFVQGLLWSPIAFLLLVPAFRAMDPSFEESAYMCGAGLWRTLYQIDLKLMLPAILAVLLLSFVRSLEAFEVPAILGIPGGVVLMATRIFLDIKRQLVPQYGLAAAYAVCLMVPISFGLYLYYKATQRSNKFFTVTGKGFRPKLIDLGRWRYLSALFVIAVPVVLILPVSVLVWISFMPFTANPSWEALSRLTLENYSGAFENTNVINSIKNTVILSLVSPTLVMVTTSVLAWIVIRTRLHGRQLLDLLATLPLVFPGIVMGLAVLRAYLVIPLPVYGTIWLLVIAFAARFLPYGIRYTYPALIQIHQELEESAYMSGASWRQTFQMVLVPLMLPALVAGWVWIFLISVRELSMAVLLSGPRSQVIAVTIFDLWEDGQLTELAAFSCVVVVVVVLLAGLVYTVSSRYGIRA